MKILMAVDGSKHSLAAVDCLVEQARRYREPPKVELVTVHLPVPKLPRMGAAVGRRQVERYYREEGEAMLAGAKRRLARAKIAYRAHVLVGPIAETIVRRAKAERCDLICLGTRGRGAVVNALLGSVATRVMHLSEVPVLLAK